MIVLFKSWVSYAAWNWTKITTKVDVALMICDVKEKNKSNEICTRIYVFQIFTANNRVQSNRNNPQLAIGYRLCIR